MYCIFQTPKDQRKLSFYFLEEALADCARFRSLLNTTHRTTSVLWWSSPLLGALSWQASQYRFLEFWISVGFSSYPILKCTNHKLSLEFSDVDFIQQRWRPAADHAEWSLQSQWNYSNCGWLGAPCHGLWKQHQLFIENSSLLLQTCTRKCALRIFFLFSSLKIVSNEMHKEVLNIKIKKVNVCFRISCCWLCWFIYFHWFPDQDVSRLLNHLSTLVISFL